MPPQIKGGDVPHCAAKKASFVSSCGVKKKLRKMKRFEERSVSLGKDRTYSLQMESFSMREWITV